MKIKKRREPIKPLMLGEESLAAPPELADPEPEVELGYVFRKRQASFYPPPAGPLPVTPQSAPVAVEEAKPPAPAPEERAAAPAETVVDVEEPPGWPVWAAAFGASILALAPIAFAWGYRDATQPLAADVLARTVFFVLALLPAVFVWGAAWLFRQGQLLAVETRRTRALAHEMVAPAALAAGEVNDVTSGLREDIAATAEAARSAHESLASMRQSLAEETQRLAEAAAVSARSARDLAQSLTKERTELGGLSETLSQRAAQVAEAITQQARMVAEASDLAETQLREAEASLTSRAADFAAAAGQASDAARIAGEDLTRHIARLETAGLGVADQVRASEQGLQEQRAALMTVAQALRADHSAFAAEAEAQAAQLSNFMLDARQAARDMGQRATETAETLRQLVAEAAAQFGELAQSAWNERQTFAERAGESLGAVTEAAAAERARLEAQAREAVEGLAKAVADTQAAAARQAQTAREQVDQLSEAAFEAGQKANQVFEARLGEARALIEGSAQLVEQAGAETARKLETGAVAARDALAELTQMLAEIDRRAAEMPVTARRQAQDVRDAVAGSIEALIEQARRTAEETQAIDSAFQDRVRRNYEMLSQAVQLMGMVTGAAAPAPAPAPAPVAEGPEAEARTVADVQAAVEAKPAPVAPKPGLTKPAWAKPETEPSALRLGLRPRLKLTPTATDQEFTQVFEAATGGRAPEEPQAPMAGSDGWTWKELLNAIDEGEAAEDIDAEALLADEISRMGIEPETLLPQGRIDALAAAIQTGDMAGAREVVANLAPAATRRLSRRVHTDPRVKTAAARYLDGYRAVLGEAAERDPGGQMVAGLLASEAGRTFLLIDAAAGDL